MAKRLVQLLDGRRIPTKLIDELLGMMAREKPKRQKAIEEIC